MFEINPKRNRMLVTVVFFIIMASILLGFINCMEEGNQPNKRPVGINLIYSYPILHVIDSDIVYYKLVDTIAIVYYNNYILYHLPKKRVFETDVKMKNQDSYFLQQRDSSYGFLFESESMNLSRRVNADSFLKRKAFAGIKLENGPNDTLIEAINNYQGILLEKYTPKQNSHSNFDTLIFYYANDFKSIDFSFSKKMDSLKQLKLFKVRLINNQSFSYPYNRMLPKREYLFEINQITEDSLRSYVQVIESLEIKR